MCKHETFWLRKKRAIFAIIAALGVLLLTACASVPEQMTQAALAGDAATLNGLLKPGTMVDTPVTVKTASPNCPGQRVLTPLQAAACAGQVAAIQKLLGGKANINLTTRSGLTPLMLAIVHGRDHAARLLITSGAALEAIDPAGNTPLLLALTAGNKSLVEFLLKNGASPKAQNHAGNTALLLANDVALSRMLTALGADPLAINNERESGLHLAAQHGNAPAAKFFLERGVDVGLRNRQGATALDLARAKDMAAANQNTRTVLAARRRGLPNGAGNPSPALDPARAQGREEVATVIAAWIDRTVRDEIAMADRAAQEGNSDKALAMYTAALGKSADAGSASENALRVKIVHYAASLPQAPGLTEKAREHLVRSAYLLKKGQDISQVENEILAALRLAPWWVEGYYNLGQLLSEQGKFDAAERNLALFIEAAPADARAQSAQDKIYEVRMAREEDGKIRSMQGRWIDDAGRGYSTTIAADKILIRSDSGLVFTLTQRNGVLDGSVEGGSYPAAHSCTIPAQMHPVTGRLAPDARRITLEYLWSRYKTNFHCVNMAGVPSNCCLLCDEVCDSVTVNGTVRTTLQLTPAR